MPEQLRPPEPEETAEEPPQETAEQSTTSAPPEAPQEDVEAAAPNRGISTSEASTNRIMTWQSSLMLQLNESKRYPVQARRLRQEGIAYLRFTMDREGNALTANIEQNSGHSLLDEETLWP